MFFAALQHSEEQCKVRGDGGTFQKDCFSLDLVWYPKEMKSIKVTFLNVWLDT